MQLQNHETKVGLYEAQGDKYRSTLVSPGAILGLYKVRQRTQQQGIDKPRAALQINSDNPHSGE
jgi:hypothetical protein